jgi:peptidoglycan/xylan/chitin deacetylase (PgdA/CDA1 family)
MKRSLIYLLLILLFVSGCSHEPAVVDDPKVIILMYHRITEGTAKNLYERSAADLERDFEYLHDNNIRVIGFNELEEIASSTLRLTTHAALITFDDGDHSWYTQAVPLLKKYEMKATFFLWTSKIGSNSFLSWDEISLMSNYVNDEGERPFVFESHTMSHQYLMTMKSALGAGEAFDNYLDEELGGSKRLIDSYAYGNVSALSLPFGDGAGDADIIAGAQRNGYHFIRTSQYSVIDPAGVNLYMLPSVPILEDTEPEVIGAYLGI